MNNGRLRWLVESMTHVGPNHASFLREVDKLTYDDIRISFYLFDSDLVYTISEEFENYNVLLNELQNRYNITYDEWLEKVAFPPFEENRITLWRHKSGII